MSDDIAQQAEPQINSKQVEEYLLKHPEFFYDHLSLLENISIPHPSGGAVSLISKQLEIFRSKHHELENQLITLIEIAKENDTSLSRMHELSLALIESNTLEDLISNLEIVFSECFLIDFIAIRIFKENTASPIKNLFINRDNEELIHFDKELSKNEPWCGKPSLAQARFLFGEVALEVKSVAIIPMIFKDLEGMIAVGSRDETRFHYSMGNLFLTQLSEVIGTRLIALID